jgi:hypothetical protein
MSLDALKRGYQPPGPDTHPPGTVTPPKATKRPGVNTSRIDGAAGGGAPMAAKAGRRK